MMRNFTAGAVVGFIIGTVATYIILGTLNEKDDVKQFSEDEKAALEYASKLESRSEREEFLNKFYRERRNQRNDRDWSRWRKTTNLMNAANTMRLSATLIERWTR